MQVRATLLGARHVPERLCGGYVYLGRYIKCSTFTFFTLLEHVMWYVRYLAPAFYFERTNVYAIQYNTRLMKVDKTQLRNIA